MKPRSLSCKHIVLPALMTVVWLLLPITGGAAQTAGVVSKTEQTQAVQPAPSSTPQTPAEEMQQLRMRYGQDPTGVRARLGMCRRGMMWGQGGRGHGPGPHNGRGHGYGRGYGRGAGQGNGGGPGYGQGWNRGCNQQGPANGEQTCPNQ